MPSQAPTAEPASEQALLQAAERAFDSGDYGKLQRELQALRGAKSAEVVTRVQALQRAISVDPVHLVLLLACLLALVVITIREGIHKSAAEHGAASGRESVYGASEQAARVSYERT